MTKRLAGAFFALLTAAALAVPADAQTLSPDEKELAAYTLTMPTVRKVAVAMKAFNDAAAEDPKAKELAKIREEMKTLEAKDELTETEEQKLEQLRARAEALDEELDRANGPGNANTIDEMVARINAHPEAAAALAKAGLTAREFSKCTLALFQAAMVKGFSQGKVDMAKLPPGINPANITFVQEHEQELADIQKEMQGGAKK
jgi:hypothetical protein